MSTWFFAAAALLCLWLRWRVGARQVDATPLLVALGPVNATAFSLRRAMSWSRGKVTLKQESKANLFASSKLAARELELRSQYRLAPLHGASTQHMYRENLYVLDLLDRYAANVKPTGAVRALDVGSQDFSYAFGLSRWLGKNASLTGIEIDGHQIYSDLHSRKDHAEAFVAQIDEGRVNYEVEDFLEHAEPNGKGQVDVISFFFPFVLEYALLRWGLPRRCFLPNRIFEHAKSLLSPGGVIVVMNHTEAERQRQLEILEECGFAIIRSGRVESDLVDYAADVPERSLTIACRASADSR